MKNKMQFWLLALLAGMALNSQVWAGGLYFGAKTGLMVLDSSFVKDDAVNTGVLVGYELGLVVADLAVEGEITTTTGDGKFKDGSKLDIDTLAAYLAVRTGGPLYLKAKGGFLQLDAGGSTESGASYGLGFGFGLGIVQLELEYTQTSIDF